MMRELEGTQKLVRVLFGESRKWHHQPLHIALVERLRKEGFAGATVMRGVAGFGASAILHSVHLLDISSDLPVIVEIVESDDRVELLLPILEEMVPHGLVTIEAVRVLRYGPGPKNRAP